MRKYIDISLGTKNLRIDIDEDLLRKLRRTLKRKLEFDSNGCLKTDYEDVETSYRVKQLALKSLLDQLSTYELNPDLKSKFDYLYHNMGGKKNTVYSSDLANIERLFGEASELYSSVKDANIPKKDKEVIDQELKEKVSNSNSLEEKIDVALEVIDNAVSEELGDYLTQDRIDEVIEDLVADSSSDEYEDIKREALEEEQTKEKQEKIVLPPDAKVEEIVAEVIKKASIGTPIEEDVIELVESKDSNKDIVSELNKLNSNIKVKGLNYRNLNYFGDSFILQCEKLARENGQSIESLFSDYFSSSGSTRANSVLNRFILSFITRNGNDSSLRGLIEATLVKKAAAKHLISNKYNYYLEEKYRYLNVNANGYIYFSDEEQASEVRETTKVEETRYQNEDVKETYRENNRDINIETSGTVNGNISNEVSGTLNNEITSNTNISGGIDSNIESNLNVNNDLHNASINSNVNTKNNLNQNIGGISNGIGAPQPGIRRNAGNNLPNAPRNINNQVTANKDAGNGTNGGVAAQSNGMGLRGNNSPIGGIAAPNTNLNGNLGNKNMAMAAVPRAGKDAVAGGQELETGALAGGSIGAQAAGIGMRNRAQSALASQKKKDKSAVSAIKGIGKKNLAQGDISSLDDNEVLDSNGAVNQDALGSGESDSTNGNTDSTNSPDEKNNSVPKNTEVNDNQTTDDNTKEDSDVVKDKLKKEIGKKLILFAKKHPAVVIAVVVGILFFLLLLFIVIGFNNQDKTKMFGLGGYPYIELNNVCEQIHVYDTPNGEDGTYPLEEYIAGVVAHEVGAFNDDTLYEVFAIAARTYALRRLQNSSDCSIAGNTTAQVFGKTDNEKIIEAVNRTRGLVLADNNTLISTEYDAFCWDTKDDKYYNVCQKDYDTGDVLKVPISWAEEYVGKISGKKFLTTPRYQSHGRGMSQQGAYYMAMELGYSREQILSFFYGNSSRLMSIYASSYTGEFPINPNDPIYQNLDFLINRSLDSLLIANDTNIGEFNNYLASVVETSGVGTREAVTNVAVSLIGSMANMGYKLNYQWGGKYYFAGVNPNWGNATNPNNYCGSYATKYNASKCLTHYKWLSFDCSGFVNWAFINGFGLKSLGELQNKGIFRLTQTSTANRKNLNANTAVCGAGDVLIKPGSHIVLIVGIDNESKRYIVAESTGSNINTKTGGVKLSYYSYNASGYFCGDMSSIYGTTANTEEE